VSFDLTDTQRRQILRGVYPHFPLEPDEAKALEPHRIKLTERLWVDVKGAKKDKKTGWYADYTVIDHRPRFMRRIGGYTHSVELAVAREGEDAVSEEFQKELTMAARERHLSTVESERAEELARRQARSINEAVREALMSRARSGLPVEGAHLADLFRAVERLQVEDEAA
jgi:hypothetical protein